MKDNIEIKILNSDELASINIEQSIFDLQQQIDSMSSQADTLDYFVSVASGILCGMLDILWVGEFSLDNGKSIADEKVNEFVTKVAKAFGCEEEELDKSVRFLEKMFPLASDGNTPDFGGGLQHHLRDFAHHPTIVGLIFSLLTQFTGKSYGTNASGNFIAVPVAKKSKKFIGKNTPDKFFKGTLVWFFHLISDIAGSSSTAGFGGGTGIPGPILSLAKEISVLPFAKDLKVNDESLSVFLSKMFNGTLFAKRDEKGKIIKDSIQKFDFRAELGVAIEIGKQAIPVIANECIVRLFYFIRRLATELKTNKVKTIKDFSKLDWGKIKPINNPTLTRMLTIATGVFTTIDMTEAIISKKYFVSVNYIGVGRFTVALGFEVSEFLKIRKVRQIKQLYEDIKRNTYTEFDNNKYERIGKEMDYDKFGLTLEQTELLYNLECHKVQNDIEKTPQIVGSEKIISLKKEWLDEWKSYISLGYPQFVNVENAKIRWYDKEELISMANKSEPEKTWLKLVLLEAMLFEPYFALSTEKDKKGKPIPSTKYKLLNTPLTGHKKSEGDEFLESYFDAHYYSKGFIQRLRKCYTSVSKELSEYLKSIITGTLITVAVATAMVLTSGMLAPKIAVLLLGSKFIGLSGAALTSACLAYIGGGAIAIGGLGMAGGTMIIVGGGAVLGVGIGAGVGGAVGVMDIISKKQIIMQSAKLMVSVREIFLNEEHDIEYSNTVLEQYVKNIEAIETDLIKLKLKADLGSAEEKKLLKQQIKTNEDAVSAMKIAMKSMNKFNSSFKIGAEATQPLV